MSAMSEAINTEAQWRTQEPSRATSVPVDNELLGMHELDQAMKVVISRERPRGSQERIVRWFYAKYLPT